MLASRKFFTALAGGVGAKAVLGAAAGRTGAGALALKATAKTLPTGSEVLGLTAASSAVEGRVPTVQDFADNAGMILGLKGMNKVSGAAFNRMRNKVVDTLYERFIERGEAPSEAIQKIMQDPVELQKVLAEKEQIKQGYREVKENPLKGTREGKDDVLVTMRPDDLRTYIINRGAAIKDPKTGDIVVQGAELAQATGTNGNFGFSKMIFKHGIELKEAQRIPEIIRTYNPVMVKNGNDTWRVPLDRRHNLIVAFAQKEGSTYKEITVFKERKNAGGEYPLSTKKEDAILRQTLDSQAQDTDRRVYSPASGSATSINSITQKGGGVKGPFQSLGGGDYGREFTAGTQIPVGEKAVLPQGQVRAQDAVKKSQIIGELVRAVGVPVDFGGKEGIAFILVKESVQHGGRVYTLELSGIKKATGQYVETLKAAFPAPVTINSIAQKEGIVNPNIYYQRGRMGADMFAPQPEVAERFKEDVQKALSDQSVAAGTLFDMGNLPGIYVELGLPPGSLKTNKTTLLKATGKAGRNLHDVPQEVLENLPALVADPLAVFKSSKNSQNPLGYVAVLNAKNKDGKQIIAVISPKGGK